MSHHHTREQQEPSDIQWKQHLFAKRMQGFQQQQQLQQLHLGARQQDNLNLAYGATEQIASDELLFMNASNYFPGKLIGGEPKLASNSHVFMAGNMNWGQRNMPLMQGIQNGLTFSQDQSQSMHLMGYLPRQLEQSLHGTPVSNGMEYLNQYIQLQGPCHDRKSVHQLMQNAGESHLERTSKQLFAFDNFRNDGHTAPYEGYSSATIMSGKKDTQGRALLCNNTAQRADNDVLGNIQQLNHLTESEHVQDLQNGPEQTDWLVKSHENMLANTAPSRGTTSLDPIEEKILFGDDDDAIWNAFHGGRNNRLPEVYLDYTIPNNDFLDVYPSHPSGTWSALMQEALEVSSSDTDQHEDWSGLGIPNTNPPPTNPVFLSDNGKHDTPSNGSFSLHTKPFQLFDEGNTNSNCRSLPGSHQTIKVPYEQSEKVHSSQQLLKGTSDTLFSENHQPYNFIGSSLQERQELQQNTSNDVWEAQPQQQTMHFMESLESRLNSPEVPHSWIHQQKMSSHNIICQSSNELSGWEVELPPDGCGQIFKNGENDDMNQYAQKNDSTAIMHKELSHTRSLGKFNESKDASSLNLPGVQEFDKSVTNDLKMSGDRTCSANFANFMNPNMARTDMVNENMLNSHQVDPKGENVVNHQNLISIYPQDWHSSSGCMNKELGETCGFSRLQPTHTSDDNRSVRGNSLLSRNDHFGLFSINQNPSSQSDESSLGYKRVQFHPTGNLEAPSHSISSGLKANEKEQLGNSQLGHASANSVNMGKTWVIDKIAPSSMPEGGTLDGPSSHLQHNQLDTSHASGLKLGPPSQKVSGHSLTNFGPRNIELLVEAPHCSWSSSTTSVTTMPTNHDASQSDNLDTKSVISARTSKEVSYSDIQHNSFGMMNQVRDQFTRQPQQLQQQQNQQTISYEPRQVQFDQSMDGADHLKYAHSVQEVVSQNMHLTDQASQVVFPSMPCNPATKIVSMGDNGVPIFSEFSSEARCNSNAINKIANQRNLSEPPPDVETVTTNLPSIAPVASKGGFSNLFNKAWRNVTNYQVSEPHSHKFTPTIFQSVNTLQPSSQEDGQIAKVGISSPELGFRSTNSQQFTYEEMPPLVANFEQKHARHMDVLSTASTSQAEKHDSKNMSANCGDPIPLIYLHQQDFRKGKNTDTHRGKVDVPTVSPSHTDQKHNYSLLQQMQAMKRTDPDLSMVLVKSLKGAESNADASSVELEGRERYICQLDPACKEPIAVSMENREKSANTSRLQIGELEYHRPISSPRHHDCFPANPQLAPSLFEQYRAYKENQTSDCLGSSLSVSKLAHCKTFEPVDNTAIVKKRDDIISETSSVPLAVDHHISPCMKVKFTDESLILSRKKRKLASPDLLPWHKAISQNYRSLPSFSATMMEWAHASNRLIEKIEDDIETVDDLSAASQSNRRLILTTQLIQQIFSPVDSKLLFWDAKTSYEEMIYYMTKVTLGEVCSLISVFENDSFQRLESGNMIPERHNKSNNLREDFFSKIVENFIARLRKLQSNFSRLDGGSLLFDARMESQDLEQGSIINRFAKFHVRVPREGFEGSSTSEVSMRRPFPQRSVTVLPMPRNLPDQVLCLSL